MDEDKVPLDDSELKAGAQGNQTNRLLCKQKGPIVAEVQGWRTTITAIVVALIVAGFAGGSSPAFAGEERMRDAFRATLSPADRKTFDAYVAAQIFHTAALDAYWSLVEKRRAGRRSKRARKLPFTKRDYAGDQPPSYEGPRLGRDLASRWSDFQDKFEAKSTGKGSEPESLPTVDDFLDSARRHFGFVPDRVPEPVFKERYAREALTLGLSGDQVVRVYALETSGLGTADMQAGIHPVRRTGRPISTALGYAQLLAANSINELSKHGRDYVTRLRRMARHAEPGSSRRESLLARADALERMTHRARSIPYKWSRHVAYSKTDIGRGIHAINLDGDIGPWLQVMKLKALRELAVKSGHSRLSGAEIELMNLAGPGTGLEMMSPVARNMPTTNFFSRSAYYRNTIVRGKTAAELLRALDERMEENMKNSGAVEFAAIFRRLEQERRAER